MKLEKKIEELKQGAIYNLGDVNGNKFKLGVDMLNIQGQGFLYCVMSINPNTYIIIPYELLLPRNTQTLYLN